MIDVNLGYEHLLPIIEKRLDELTLSNADVPDTLTEAMRYSLLDAGKRVRPVLMLAFCQACGGNPEDALDAACALEIVHTYSLIHDDLPCMDDDDMRRGKPSCHKVYGEDMALLAGDALQSLAFECLLACGNSDVRTARAALHFARCIGQSGMVGGQVIDLQSEGKRVPVEVLEKMDAGKTCALIDAACVMGCIYANASDEQIEAAHRYAHALGMAFQIIDDILDVTSDSQTLGKPVMSDAGNEKSTYVSLLGLEEARARAHEYTQQACSSLEMFGDRGEYLVQYALQLENRLN